MSSISVLVTGGCGFLGSCIVEALLEKHSDWAVHVFDLSKPKVSKENVNYLTGSTTSRNDMDNILQECKPDVIIHTVGLTPELTERHKRNLQKKIWAVNVEGTRNVVEAAEAFGVKAFVHTSSMTAVTDDFRFSYPNIDESWPTSNQSTIYGESKAAGEEIVLAASKGNFVTCALRPPAIYGPGDISLVPSIHACIANGETPWIIGSGTNLWDLCCVTNIADAHVLAAENLLSSKSAAGEAFFITDDEPVAVRDLCLAIWKHFGHSPPFELSLPKSVAIVAAYITEWLCKLTGKPMTLSPGSIQDATAMRYANITKAKKLLNYRPRVGLVEGLRDTCEAYAIKLRQKPL